MMTHNAIENGGPLTTKDEDDRLRYPDIYYSFHRYCILSFLILNAHYIFDVELDVSLIPGIKSSNLKFDYAVPAILFFAGLYFYFSFFAEWYINAFNRYSSVKGILIQFEEKSDRLSEEQKHIISGLGSFVNLSKEVNQFLSNPREFILSTQYHIRKDLAGKSQKLLESIIPYFNTLNNKCIELESRKAWLSDNHKQDEIIDNQIESIVNDIKSISSDSAKIASKLMGDIEVGIIGTGEMYIGPETSIEGKLNKFEEISKSINESIIMLNAAKTMCKRK